MKRILILALAIISLMPFSAVASTWTLDPAHTVIQFKVKHLMIAHVKGVFEKFRGTIALDDKDITKSKVDVTIDIASVNTNIGKRDDHLRSADFFDAAKYPVMTFVSNKVEKGKAGMLRVHGILTIKGNARPVVLEVEGPTAEIKTPQGEVKRGASASAVINRKDFGVLWNKSMDNGGVVVGEEVAISIDAELVKE